MRPLKCETFAVRGRTPLVVRGSLPSTFRGMGLFAEASLFCWGIYLLMGALRKPLEADPVTILAAGVVLGLAAILLCYLVRPGCREMLADQEESGNEADSAPEPLLTSCSEATKTRRNVELTLEKDDDLPDPM